MYSENSSQTTFFIKKPTKMEHLSFIIICSFLAIYIPFSKRGGILKNLLEYLEMYKKNE